MASRTKPVRWPRGVGTFPLAFENLPRAAREHQDRLAGLHERATTLRRPLHRAEETQEVAPAGDPEVDVISERAQLETALLAYAADRAQRNPTFAAVESGVSPMRAAGR
jgi:hypothetical protein